MYDRWDCFLSSYKIVLDITKARFSVTESPEASLLPVGLGH